LHHRNDGAAHHFPLAAQPAPESMQPQRIPLPAAAGVRGKKGSLRDKKLSINDIVI
jgi:hypothetical protein